MQGCHIVSQPPILQGGHNCPGCAGKSFVCTYRAENMDTNFTILQFYVVDPYPEPQK